MWGWSARPARLGERPALSENTAPLRQFAHSELRVPMEVTALASEALNVCKKLPGRSRS